MDERRRVADHVRVTAGGPPIGSTVFAVFEMRKAVERLKRELGRLDGTTAELLEAVENANRWTLTVETLLADEKLARMRALLEEAESRGRTGETS